MYPYLILGSLLYMIFLLNLPLFYTKNNGMTHLKLMQLIFLIPIIIFLFFMTVLRSINVGIDYPMYHSFYVNGDYGKYFDYLIILIYDFARQEGNFLIFTAMITGLFLMFNLMAIKKVSYNFFVSFTFFILSYYFFYVFNGMRQAVAISVVFLGITYILKKQLKTKDFLVYLLLIILAMQFHHSAIYMFPIIFLRLLKINKPIVIIAFICTVSGYFFALPKEIVSDLLINFNYYSQKYLNNSEFFFTVNKQKGLIEFFPVLIQYFFLYYILSIKKAEKVSDKFILTYYLGFLFLYSGSGIEAVDRFQFYFYPSVILFYDYLIHSIYESKEIENRRSLIGISKTMAIASVSFWFLYFVIRVIQGTHGINPYILMN
ncbi:EpsG family protein [Planococcus shixiaomingii]|uniref:EpsG family protein n=1 Tax=Planococcus shixiaomingii TaxID=3058393 RepID=UPI00260232A1|nr:EpsG family protein [Planococcus sp. N022]WKA53962.1 EpsG family protein [Planococcus sp. N022]